ncbi:MAG: DUF4167 domain-containing protein [Pseudomonadota bacterium]
MRQSPKSNRPRNKNGRKPSGPSPNRVYESTGPEGKVRGTPQQIIDKYQSLARDRATAGDRVLAESFLQHAEHYMRILTASQPQMRSDERSESRVDGGEDRDERLDDAAPEERAVERAGDGPEPETDVVEPGAPLSDSLAVIGPEGDDGAGPSMIEAAESAPRRRTRRPARRTKAEDDGETAASAPGAEEPRPRPRRRKAAEERAPAEASGDQAAPELALGSEPDGASGSDDEPIRAAQ